MTLREHLEAIRDLTAIGINNNAACHEHAVAAIAILDNAEHMTRIGRAFYDDTDEGQPVLVIPLDAP